MEEKQELKGHKPLNRIPKRTKHCMHFICRADLTCSFNCSCSSLKYWVHSAVAAWFFHNLLSVYGRLEEFSDCFLWFGQLIYVHGLRRGKSTNSLKRIQNRKNPLKLTKPKAQLQVPLAKNNLSKSSVFTQWLKSKY